MRTWKKGNILMYSANGKEPAKKAKVLQYHLRTAYKIELLDGDGDIDGVKSPQMRPVGGGFVGVTAQCKEPVVEEPAEASNPKINCRVVIAFRSAAPSPARRSAASNPIPIPMTSQQSPRQQLQPKSQEISMGQLTLPLRIKQGVPDSKNLTRSCTM